jgi:DNA-binding GntR family transcriptional regulator
VKAASLASPMSGAQAERVLRRRILDGELEPGTPLRESRLSTSLGVSRNTLRESFRALAEQGLVTYLPNRGVVVTDLTEEDVADLYRLRAVLELAALREIDGTRLAELERATSAFADALERNDAIDALECDFAFHRILIDGLGSRRLTAAYERAQAELRLALLQLDRDYEPPQVEEHQRIVDALRGGGSRAAARALSAHLQRAAERLQKLIRDKLTTKPERSITDA